MTLAGTGTLKLENAIPPLSMAAGYNEIIIQTIKTNSTVNQRAVHKWKHGKIDKIMGLIPIPRELKLA